MKNIFSIDAHILKLRVTAKCDQYQKFPQKMQKFQKFFLISSFHWYTLYIYRFLLWGDLYWNLMQNIFLINNIPKKLGFRDDLDQYMEKVEKFPKIFYLKNSLVSSVISLIYNISTDLFCSKTDTKIWWRIFSPLTLMP